MKIKIIFEKNSKNSKKLINKQFINYLSFFILNIKVNKINLGSAANVRSLYALFGGYSHNSEVFE